MPSHSALERELQQEELRQMLARLVGSRVPAADCDDVLQTAMCAALAAKAVPDERARRRRWLVGLTKHKIADYYRGARRSEPPEPAPTDAIHTPSAHGESEARDLLRHIVGDLEHDERAMQTLRWIVREHEGERLADIARNENVASSAVRQRVSRLRRALRSRWLPLAAAVVATMALFAHAVHDRTTDPSESAVAGPVVVSIEDAHGPWTVASLHADPDVPAATRVLAESLASQIRVQVEGDPVTGHTVHIDNPVENVTGTLTGGDAQALRGTQVVWLQKPDGSRSAMVVLAQSDDEIQLEGSHGAWHGRVVLRRE